MYPNEEQKVLIEKHIGSCRFVWNHFLDMRNKRYTETGNGMSYKEMQLFLPSLKEEKEWLREINSQSLQVTLQQLDASFGKFFKNISRYPSFKKKNNSGSFTVPQHFTINDKSVTIPKFGSPLRVIMHRDIDGDARSLTISKTPSGKYYVSILTKAAAEIPKAKEIEARSATGIDMGITQFLTTSGGIQISNPKNLDRSEKLLARRQKQLSRKHKGSSNRNKARIKIARIQEHMANQRNDFHNKISDAMLKAYD
ncbi:MAG: RNA-guided endonuclease TnpB family protein, partial [Thermoplasmata archaeon]